MSLHYVSKPFLLCQLTVRPVSSGITLVCDSSVVRSVPSGLPAALPLPQPAHQRAVSSTREGAPSGAQSFREQHTNTSSPSTIIHHLGLSQRDRGWLCKEEENDFLCYLS